MPPNPFSCISTRNRLFGSYKVDDKISHKRQEVAQPLINPCIFVRFTALRSLFNWTTIYIVGEARYG